MSAALEADRLGDLLLAILDGATIAQLVGPAKRVPADVRFADRVLAACTVALDGRVFVVHARDGGRLLARVPGAVLRTEVA